MITKIKLPSIPAEPDPYMLSEQKNMALIKLGHLRYVVDQINDLSLTLQIPVFSSGSLAPIPEDSSYVIPYVTSGLLYYRQSDSTSVLVGPSSGSGIVLRTDGALNGSQSLLNLTAGTNVTLTDNGSGTITIDAIGGGSPIYPLNEISFGDGVTPGGITSSNLTYDVSNSIFIATGTNGTSIGTIIAQPGFLELHASNSGTGDNLFFDVNSSIPAIKWGYANGGPFVQTYLPLTYTDPIDNGKVLTLDSATGQTSWQSAGGGSPVYPNTQIVFGDGVTAGGTTNPNLNFTPSTSFHGIVTDASTYTSHIDLVVASAGVTYKDLSNNITSNITLNNSRSILFTSDVPNDRLAVLNQLVSSGTELRYADGVAQIDVKLDLNTTTASLFFQNTATSAKTGVSFDDQLTTIGTPIAGNTSTIIIDDTAQTYTLNKLATGGAAQMVVADTTGVLSTQAIPGGGGAPVYPINEIVFGDGITPGGTTNSAFAYVGSSGNFVVSSAVAGATISFSIENDANTFRLFDQDDGSGIYFAGATSVGGSNVTGLLIDVVDGYYMFGDGGATGNGSFISIDDVNQRYLLGTNFLLSDNATVELLLGLDLAKLNLDFNVTNNTFSLNDFESNPLGGTGIYYAGTGSAGLSPVTGLGIDILNSTYILGDGPNQLGLGINTTTDDYFLGNSSDNKSIIIGSIATQVLSGTSSLTVNFNSSFTFAGSNILNIGVKEIDFTAVNSVGFWKNNGSGLISYVNFVTPVGTTYTPTLGGGTTSNVTSSTAKNCQYTQTGNIVTVTGSLGIVTTLAVATVIEISLPIASNFAVVTDLNGVGSASSAIATNGYLEGVVANDTAALKFIGLSVGGSGNIYFSFSYTII